MNIQVFRRAAATVGALSAALATLAVAGSALAVTTLSTNMATGGTLDVTGASTLVGNVGMYGNLAVTGTLGVTGASTLTGATILGNTADIYGNTAVTGTFRVYGNTTASGTLAVAGVSTLTGNVDMAGALTTLGTARFNTVNVSSTLTVGSLTLNGLGVYGDTLVTGTLRTTSDTNVGGILTVLGATRVNTLAASSTLAVTGASTLTGATILGNTADIYGNTAVTGTFRVYGNTTASGTLAVAGVSTLTGNVDMAGALTTLGTARFNTVNVSSTLTVGSLTLNGLGVYGDTLVTGTLRTTSDTNVGGILTVLGATRVGTLAASSTLAVTGASTFATTTFSGGGWTGTAISALLYGSGSLTFDQTAANTCQTVTTTVTGARDGDPVALGVADALATTASSTMSAWVSANDYVSIRRCNVAATTAPGAQTVKVLVWKLN